MVIHVRPVVLLVFFFFNDTATTEIYTLSLHDALPIYSVERSAAALARGRADLSTLFQRGLAMKRLLVTACLALLVAADRKSTRLNSSHANISYAVFCLKKKKVRLRDSAYRLITLISL